VTDHQPPNRFAAFARLRGNFRLRGSMRRAADLVALAYIGFIASMATLTGAYYMLFPELSALSWDVMELPQGRWARAPIMLALTPALTGVIGTIVTRRMSYGIISVLLTVFVCVAVIRMLRSPVAPAISAGLLPLVLGVTSWWYAPCILFGTTVLALLSIPWKHFAATHPDNSGPLVNNSESSVRNAESSLKTGVSSAKSGVPPFAYSSPADKSDSSVKSSNPPFTESPGATTGSLLADSSIAVTDALPASPPHESTASDPVPPHENTGDAIDLPTAAAADSLADSARTTDPLFFGSSHTAEATAAADASSSAESPRAATPPPAFSLDEATGADTPPPPHAHEVPANDTQPPPSQSDAFPASAESLTTAANAAPSAESLGAGYSSRGTAADDASSAAAGSSRYAADAPHATYVRSAESPRAATNAPNASPPHENTGDAIDVPTAAAALRLLIPLLSFVALAMLAVKLTGMRFVLFPPLVVILYEMLSHREHCPWVGRPIAIPVACFASATGGYLFFAHLPFAPLVAMLSMAWGIAVLRTLNLHMPPVLAVALLPLVMTNPTIGYPIAVGLGTTLASAWFEFLARWHWIAPLPSPRPHPDAL
jgi:hypothetical protein